MEIARQLTLIQSEYFRAIHPSELVDASWMKDEKKEKASPNLLKLNRFETTVSDVVVLLCTCESLSYIGCLSGFQLAYEGDCYHGEC